MKNEELLKYLQEIEIKFDVERLVYKEIEFWPYLRIILYSENSTRNGASDVRTESIKNKLVYVWKSFFERFYDIRRHKKLKRANLYFLTASNSRYYLYNRGNFNPYVSPLVEWSRCSSHIDEFVSMGNYRLPRSEKSSFIQKNIYLNFIKSFFLFKKSENDVDEQLISIFDFLLKKGYKTDFTLKKVKSRLNQMFLLSKWFKNRLKYINPKLAFVVCYYSTSSFALINAAKSLGIKTVDLQHGVQSKEHIAYSTFNKIPVNGWKLLPDIFWNWTKNDVDYINSWGKSKHIGLNGGIIWHSYLRNNLEFNKYWTDKLNSLNFQKKPCVLVTFQPLNDNDLFINMLKKTIESEKGDKYFWLLRLHPGMMQEINKYKEVFKYANSDVEIGSQAPLPILLKNVGLHITRYSSTVIESYFYGIPSFVEKGYNYFDMYAKSGGIIYFYNDLTCLFSTYFNKRTDEKNEELVDSQEVFKTLNRFKI